MKRFIAAATDDGLILRTTGDEGIATTTRHYLKGDEVLCCDFSCDGMHLFAGTKDGIVVQYPTITDEHLDKSFQEWECPRSMFETETRILSVSALATEVAVLDLSGAGGIPLSELAELLLFLLLLVSGLLLLLSF